LRGLTFGSEDVVGLEAEGAAHHLVLPQEDLFLAADRSILDRFLEEGASRGTPGRLKCRTREPWWRVPGVQTADVLVGYMAGAFPRAAAVRNGAFYTNSLHGVQLRSDIPPEWIALCFYSSLTLLSLEIEGRSYGGGILKVEPRELDRALVPLAQTAPGPWESLVGEVDRLLREGRFEEANGRVDAVVLGDGLGLEEAEIRKLRSARERLMKRRMGRRL
jgi:hypothetical protein